MLGGEDDSIAMEDENKDEKISGQEEERGQNPWWMESTGGFVDHADFETAVEEFEREREEFKREKHEFKREKEEFKRERDNKKRSRKMDASDCSSDATEVYNEVKKNAQGLAFENHIKQLDLTWFTTSEDVYKKITLAEDQYSSLDAEEMEDIINIRLEKLMELEIARVRLQCQELVLQKIAGWDDFKNMKYKEVKDEMRNIQPSFNDAQLQKIFEKSCIDMCTDIGSEQDSSGLISEDLKARILELLNGEFELLLEDIEKFRVILIPFPERYTID